MRMRVLGCVGEFHGKENEQFHGNRVDIGFYKATLAL